MKWQFLHYLHRRIVDFWMEVQIRKSMLKIYEWKIWQLKVKPTFLHSNSANTMFWPVFMNIFLTIIIWLLVFVDSLGPNHVIFYIVSIILVDIVLCILLTQLELELSMWMQDALESFSPKWQILFKYDFMCCNCPSSAHVLMIGPAFESCYLRCRRSMWNHGGSRDDCDRVLFHTSFYILLPRMS